MRTKATVLSFTLLSLATVARAADEGPTMSGFAETTYNYNFNGPTSDTNQGHSFDNQANTFALNNAQLLIQGNPRGDKEVGYTLRVDYGTDATVIDPAASGLVTVEEAYGTYVDSGSKLGLKAGKFVTYEGIEVIEAIADPTITRGFIFGLAEPFTHTGAVLTYQINPQIDVAAGLVNGWDLITDNNSGKTFIWKGTYNGGNDLVLTFSGTYGPEKAAAAFPASNDDNRLSLDLTGVTKAINNLDLNFQLNYGMEEHSAVSDPNKSGKWIGFGVQPVYHIDKKLTLGARFEIFKDSDGARTGTDDLRLTTFSICPGYQVTDHFLARLELRVDRANQEVFDSRDGAATKKGQFEAIAETIFSF